MLAATGRRVELFDERLTTVTAHQALADGGTPARDHRAVVDQTAAAVLLAAWLEPGRVGIARDRVRSTISPDRRDGGAGPDRRRTRQLDAGAPPTRPGRPPDAGPSGRPSARRRPAPPPVADRRRWSSWRRRGRRGRRGTSGSPREADPSGPPGPGHRHRAEGAGRDQVASTAAVQGGHRQRVRLPDLERSSTPPRALQPGTYAFTPELQLLDGRRRRARPPAPTSSRWSCRPASPWPRWPTGWGSSPVTTRPPSRRWPPAAPCTRPGSRPGSTSLEGLLGTGHLRAWCPARPTPSC